MTKNLIEDLMQLKYQRAHFHPRPGLDSACLAPQFCLPSRPEESFLMVSQILRPQSDHVYASKQVSDCEDAGCTDLKLAVFHM